MSKTYVVTSTDFPFKNYKKNSFLKKQKYCIAFSHILRVLWRNKINVPNRISENEETQVSTQLRNQFLDCFKLVLVKRLFLGVFQIFSLLTSVLKSSIVNC